MTVTGAGQADLEVESDVLVIGGGIAGCLAAIKAREAGLSVVLTDKANVGRSGASHQMSGVFTCFDHREDDHSLWYQECLEAGQGLVDRSILDGMIDETTETVRELEGWGVEFLKQKGRYVRRPGAAHIHARNVVMANGGFQLMSVVRGETLRREVRLHERVMVTDLLTSDGQVPTSGRVAGAVGFHARTGKTYLFKARATVVATGGCSSSVVSSPWYPSLSGDGRRMCFELGAKVRNMDISRFSPKPLLFNTAPGQNILVGEGAIYVNARGERFMERWDPVRLERAPKDVISRAIATELLEGRGPVYMDITKASEEAFQHIEKAIPILVKSFAKAGLSLRETPMEYTANVGDVPGGVWTDKWGTTSIPGLFVAGGTSDHGEDGVSNVITHGMEAAIRGRRAGVGAARYASGVEAPPIRVKQVRTCLGKMFTPLKREKGFTYREARERTQPIADESLLGAARNEARLKRAISLVEAVRGEVAPRLMARDFHELCRVHGFSGELIYLELLARCALFRTESRGGHYREDYPKRDDRNWLKWVFAQREGDGIRLWAEPVQ